MSVYRCAVFSDSHGDTRYMERVMERVGKVDMIVHLGDLYRDTVWLQKRYPDIPVEFVIGNNDFWAGGEKSKLIRIDSHPVFITHGHLFRSAADLAARAKESGAEMALYGHTHMVSQEVREGIPVLNFGSISFPRSGNRSCGIIESENGKLSAMVYDYIG